jgi:hypothetical protein
VGSSAAGWGGILAEHLDRLATSDTSSSGSSSSGSDYSSSGNNYSGSSSSSSSSSDSSSSSGGVDDIEGPDSPSLPSRPPTAADRISTRTGIEIVSDRDSYRFSTSLPLSLGFRDFIIAEREVRKHVEEGVDGVEGDGGDRGEGGGGGEGGDRGDGGRSGFVQAWQILRPTIIDPSPLGTIAVLRDIVSYTAIESLLRAEQFETVKPLLRERSKLVPQDGQSFRRLAYVYSR